MDIIFWVLPEFEEEGKWLFPQFAEQIRFLEDKFGPYPFRADKYGVAHAPFLGMEHQSLIAYGASFENDNMFGMNAGFDDLHQHELAHEWGGTWGRSGAGKISGFMKGSVIILKALTPGPVPAR